MEQFRTSSTGTSPATPWAMASQFAADHPDEIDGLILLGAISTANTRPQTPSPSTAPESERGGRDRLHRERGGIQGGNHAQFGNYGPQKGEAPATISAEEQQARTVEAVAEFIARRQG